MESQQAVHHPPVPQKGHIGDTVDPELLGDPLVPIDVDPVDPHRVGILPCHILQQRFQVPAGSAPFRIEVDQEDMVPGSVQDAGEFGSALQDPDPGRGWAGGLPGGLPAGKQESQEKGRCGGTQPPRPETVSALGALRVWGRHVGPSSGCGPSCPPTGRRGRRPGG